MGIKIVTEDGNGLEWLREKAEIRIGKRHDDGSLNADYISKVTVFDPLILCAWCMPSFYSIFGYGFTWLFLLLECSPWNNFYFAFYPITVGASSFISGMLYMAYECLYLSNIFRINKLNSGQDIEGLGKE